MKKIICSVFLLACTLQAGIVIDDSNPVVFGSNLIELGADTLVTVSANNVTIDFNEKIIAGGDTGILILEGISGVTLRNGTVASLTGTGIVIEQNCSNITIENMKFSQCASGVMDVKGTSTDNAVSDVVVESLIAQSCCLSPLAQSAISASYTSNLFLNSVRVLNSGNDSASLNMYNFDNCDRFVLFAVGVASSRALNFVGFNFTNCNTILTKECRVANNWADLTSGDLTAFNFTGTCCDNIFSEALVLTNSCGGDCIGFNMEGKSEAISISLTRIVGNYTQNGNFCGFRFAGTGAVNRDNAINETFVVNNTSDGSGAEAAGIVVDGSDRGLVNHCIISFQQSHNGSGYGMLFTSTGGDSWSVNDSQFIKNQGNSDANSYGIRVVGGTGNLFIKNFAFDNGNTAANQMNGVSTGSITELNTDNLNNAQSPWANIVVTN